MLYLDMGEIVIVFKRKVPIRRKIRYSVEHNKTVVVFGFTYLGTLIWSAFANILTEFNDLLRVPYEFLATWTYQEKWLPWVHFNLMFWPLVGVIWLLRSLLLHVWRKYVDHTEEEPVAPTVLYKDEFAAAVEAIDQVTSVSANEALEDLLLTIADTIAVNLGLRKKDYRMMFFTPVTSHAGIKIAGFRLGKQFELADKGRLDPTEFYHTDLLYIERCLEQPNTELVIPNIPLHDAQTVLFARNPGNLRLGLYIAVLKSEFDIEMAKSIFPQVTHIITTLAFMDEMIDYIVQYDQGGVDDDA